MKRRILILLLSFAPVVSLAQVPVDLGLSVKWADRNVGAETSAGQGSLFAWGAVAPVQYYDWAFYPLCGGNFNELTKYNTDSNLGAVDSLTVLQAGDDAASVNLGDGWRMPTNEEMKELTDNCDWILERRGCRFRSRINGAELFLPFVGAKSGGEIYSSSLGYYWSSSLCESSCWSAVALSFYPGRVERPVFGRYLGCAVRAVKK